MALTDFKITEFDKKISELATKPSATTGLTDVQVKAWWDSSPEELRVKLNALIDALVAITAAGEIGIDSPYGGTVKAVLEYIISQGSGTIPGADAVNTDAIQDEAITLAKMGFDVSTQTELDAAISSLTGLINGLAGAGRTTETVKSAYDLAALASALNILTAQGDLLGRDLATLIRIAKGTAYQVLGMNSGATAQQYMASLQSLITQAGDLIYGSAANTPAKRSIGSEGQILGVASGLPAWENKLNIVGARGNGSSNQSIATNTSYTITIPTGINVRKARLALYGMGGASFGDIEIDVSGYIQMIGTPGGGNNYTNINQFPAWFGNSPSGAYIVFNGVSLNGQYIFLTFRNGNSSPDSLNMSYVWSAIGLG